MEVSNRMGYFQPFFNTKLYQDNDYNPKQKKNKLRIN